MVGNQIEATKISTKFLAMGGTQLTIQKFYDIYFKALKGFASGKPSIDERWGWKVYIIPSVDNKSICDDKGFEGMKIKDRCKIIRKEDPLTPQSLKWIKKELTPYFKKNYKSQMKKIKVIVNDIDLLSIRKEVNGSKKYLEAK